MPTVTLIRPDPSNYERHVFILERLTILASGAVVPSKVTSIVYVWGVDDLLDLYTRQRDAFNKDTDRPVRLKIGHRTYTCDRTVAESIFSMCEDWFWDFSNPIDGRAD